MMKHSVSAVTVSAALLVQGCLLDIAPARGPVDRLWEEKMLAADFGAWRNGKREFCCHDQRADAIHWSAWQASNTKYGISIRKTGPLGIAAWYEDGGLIGRAPASGNATVELFLREIVRVHEPMGGADYGRDYRYDLFLLVRPSTGRARLIKRWAINPRDISLTISADKEADLRRLARSERKAQQLVEENKSINVRGELRFDPTTEIAIVTVLGVKRPFEERVDLSEELRR